MMKRHFSLLLCSIWIMTMAACAGTYDLDLHRQKGFNYYESGLYKKAEKEFKGVLKRQPKDSEVHYKLGVIYYKKGLLEKSLEEFITAISIDPDCSKAYYNLGVIHSEKGPYYNIAKTSDYFKKYLKQVPDSEHREKIEYWQMNHHERLKSSVSDDHALDKDSKKQAE